MPRQSPRVFSHLFFFFLLLDCFRVHIPNLLSDGISLVPQKYRLFQMMRSSQVLKYPGLSKLYAVQFPQTRCHWPQKVFEIRDTISTTPTLLSSSPLSLSPAIWCPHFSMARRLFLDSLFFAQDSFLHGILELVTVRPTGGIELPAPSSDVNIILPLQRFPMSPARSEPQLPPIYRAWRLQ